MRKVWPRRSCGRIMGPNGSASASTAGSASSTSGPRDPPKLGSNIYASSRSSKPTADASCPGTSPALPSKRSSPLTLLFLHDSESNELYRAKMALAPVVELYGPKRASEFGPLALKAVRQTFVEKGLARQYCNVQASRIRTCWNCYRRGDHSRGAARGTENAGRR